MDIKDCYVGQSVYVIEGSGNDWMSNAAPTTIELLNAARKTIILAIDGQTNNDHGVIVYRPPALGGYLINCRNGEMHLDAWRMFASQLKPLTTQHPLSAKPYPHRCKVCNSPARNVGKVILCSQDKCKSKRTTKAIVPKHMKKVSSLREVDAQGFVICPKCGEKATIYTDAVRKPLACDNGHEWLHKWKPGQKLYMGQYSRGYVYTETGWENG